MFIPFFIFIASIAIIIFNINRAIKNRAYLDSILNFSLLLLGYASFVLLSNLAFKYKIKFILPYIPGIAFLFSSILLFLILLPFLKNIKLYFRFKFKLFFTISVISIFFGFLIKFYILINFGTILLSYVLFWFLLKTFKNFQKNAGI